jgi:Sec-independent protein translocase protein TatA
MQFILRSSGVVLMLIFGEKLPEMGRSLSSGLGGFTTELSDGSRDPDELAAENGQEKTPDAE